MWSLCVEQLRSDLTGISVLRRWRDQMENDGEKAFSGKGFMTPEKEELHRLCLCSWKQWRYCRTRIRELTRLGTFLRTAIPVGLSRKGPWRLSRTLATHSDMTNQWLRDQGLLSIKDLWVNMHYPATAR